ncbi:WD40-repeat-containing domain protein [Mycena metata]|uniref:WD40-repeat-containing domain protein n=1 Tax=Mycena metata TaxID=1033252 RepID=A0AAD7I8C9_9AGAR|nr:WD40-repeat-containing domain protein [Mycena metata]
MRTAARLPYVQHQGIDRHPGNVMAMAVNENGTILASGGSQGTWLWNVADMSPLRRPSGASSRGATLVIIWARQTDEAHDVLYGGTQNGYFFCWRQKNGVFEETFAIQIPEPSEITAMAFDSTNNRLCLCSRNDIVQSWAISKDPVTGKWTPTNIFSRKFSRLSPQAITFAAFDNSQDRDIIVLGFHNSGPVYTLRGKTGETASAWSVGAKIGDAAFHWRDGVFCVEDPYSGPSLFRLSDQIKSNGYEIDRSRGDVRPRKVRFGEQGATLVCGSDHGCVYVFDTRSGAELAVLSVGSTEWVQVVETAEVDDVSVIFAAQTGSLDSCEEIFVWKRAQPARNTGTTLEKLVWVAKALVVLGFLAFVYQNMEATVGPVRKVAGAFGGARARTTDLKGSVSGDKVTGAFGGAQARTTNLKGSVSGDLKGGAGKDSKDFVVVDVRREL